MGKDYYFAFGSGNPTTNASLTPTFITFANTSGTTYAAPSILERPAGSGLYTVNYGATQTMAFIMDGATSGLATTDRYIAGVMDPYDQFGVTLNATYAYGATGFALESAGNTLISALGLTMIAQGLKLTVIGNSLATMGGSLSIMGGSLSIMGNSLSVMGSTLGGFAIVLGSTASSYGSTNVDPVDVMGYLKRARELNEGNQMYTKATGILDLYVRGGVTLLIEKTISDSAATTTKT